MPEPYSNLLGPFQPIITISQQFYVSLRDVCLCMSRPKVLQRLRTLCRLQLRDAEAPEDVKSTLFMV